MTGKPIPEAFEQDLELTRQVAPVLTPGLSGSPRRTKRFLNALLLRMGMAEDRKIKLSRQILAKLMVLEYLKPTFYRQLAELQAGADGLPTSIVEAEKAVRTKEAEGGAGEEAPAGKSKRSTATAPEAGELQPWLADQWTSAWLASDPTLAGVDLRPYYFVARPRDTRLDGTGPALSPGGEEVLRGLLETDRVLVQQALAGLKDLGEADAAAVFERLAQRLRRSEKADSDTLQHRLVDIAKARPTLTASLVAVFGDLPHSKVALATPMRLVDVVVGTAASASARTLLTTWAASGLANLEKTAKSALERLAS